MHVYTINICFIKCHRPDYVSELERIKTIHFNSTLALHRYIIIYHRDIILNNEALNVDLLQQISDLTGVFQNADVACYWRKAEAE